MKNWSAASLRNAGLCASHFQPNEFDANGRLHRDAVPVPFFVPEEVQDDNVAGPSHKVSTSLSASSVQVEQFYPPKESEPSTIVVTTTSNKSEDHMDVDKVNLSFHAQMIPSTRKYAKRTVLSFESSEDEVMIWTAIDPYSAKTSIGHAPAKRKRRNRNFGRSKAASTVQAQV